jgi:nicotinamidase-related amidase
LIRLVVVVEGQTEEAFVKEVLCPHLAARQVFTSAMIVATRRDPRTGAKSKGGGRRWAKWRNDIDKVLRTEASPQLRVTTLFDLYALPLDFPGADEHGELPDTVRRACVLEAAMAGAFDDWRLVPYLQRHEFEALVIAGIDQLPALLDPVHHAAVAALGAEVAGIAPEDVNDSEHTAPSKRLLKHLGATYEKVTLGTLVTIAAGLPAIRAACPRFDAWVTTLENLATETP